jgi:hypothetical protein
MALQFKTDDKSLMISGKTFDIKDIIKSHGGRWDSQKQWCVPIEKDSPEFRASLLHTLSAVVKARDAAAAAERAYSRSPEGIAAAKANERAIIKRLAEQGSSWICCENCVVVDWLRQHTTCDTCASDCGSYKNSFRVRDMVYTGD